jgi:hypothetical protein
MNQKCNFFSFSRYLFIILLFIVFSTLIFLIFLNSTLLSRFDYLFFRAISLLTLSILVTLLCFSKIYKTLDCRDLVLFSIVSFSANWFVYGLIPFNVSRSNSVILIGYLNTKNGGVVQKAEIKQVLNTIYFDRNNAVEVRLNEQIFNGVVERVDDGYRITNSGMRQVKLLRSIANLYGVKNNFLDSNLYDDVNE